MKIKCEYCETMIDSDIAKEELGMCIECSNNYWGHAGAWAE